MSSIWWLGWSCMLGLGSSSHTVQNLRRERECVINLPSAEMAGVVDRLAMLTGSNPVPEKKQQRGYVHEARKFEVARLTSLPSDRVEARRVTECPVQLEAVLEAEHPFGQGPGRAGSMAAFEMRIVRVHVEESLLRRDVDHHVDPDAWKPLIMSFCHFYGTTERLHPSRLAAIPESLYRPAERMER
jgi:flavin reductase (DIM6/NTAB) family NADH-FMN oxidoreductase RutF